MISVRRDAREVTFSRSSKAGIAASSWTSRTCSTFAILAVGLRREIGFAP